MHKGQNRLDLGDVLLFPKLGKNLYSPGQATRLGLKFLLSNDHLTIFNGKGFEPPKGEVIAQIKKGQDNFYRLSSDSIINLHNAAFANPAKDPIPLGLWHRRLGHTNYNDIQRLIGCGAL